MKKTLMALALLTSASAFSQSYYGASVGVGIGKTYNIKTKLPGYQVNDLYLSVPVGGPIFNIGENNDIIADGELTGTAALNVMMSCSIGFRSQETDGDYGAHILIGYTDLLIYSSKPFQLTHHFYPSATLRTWKGHFMMQLKYVHVPTSAGTGEIYVGIGVIGL
jgi:hypothetical protein